jgi:choloylglycine hydrolase
MNDGKHGKGQGHMCTAITFQCGQMQNFFGRTRDFSYPIDPQIFIVPKNFSWQSALDGKIFTDSYSFITIGQEEAGMLGFFDGVNENGFAAAALYFTGYAEYGTGPDNSGKEPISSLEFLHFILGRCGSVEELKGMLPHVAIIGLPDPVTQTAAPLHWIAADRSGACIVMEPTGRGFQLFDNPIGVLANSPAFPWQVTNLRNYMGVSPEQESQADWGKVKLTPFGQAAGTRLLPGGYTSPERFVRTAFQKTHVLQPENVNEAVVTCFHIMDSVTVPKGAVVTDRGTYDYTQYTAFSNIDTCEYFFKAYGGSAIETAGLWGHDLNADHIICFGPLTQQPVFMRR